MKIDLSQFREIFLEESGEHIVSIESGLLRLKSGGADDETLNSIFRAAHSIKGGAGAFGLTNVVQFTHVLENLFDQMREHRVPVTAELISLLLSANDVLKDLIASTDGSAPPNAEEIRRRLETAASADSAAAHADAAAVLQKTPDAESGETHYLITFRPSSELFGTGSDPLLLLRNLCALGRVASIKLDTSELPSLAQLAPEESYFSWEVELLSRAPRQELDEIFEFVLDCAKVRISEKPVAVSPAAAKSAAHPSPAKDNQPSGHLPKDNSGSKSVPARNEGPSVRVATEKIDKLIDIVGEMVIAHSITTRLLESLPAEFAAILQESVASLERHILDLHERALSVRMLPLGSLFSRFNRLIHDLGVKTGKQLKLVTEGEETEVDRNILELLGDPLTHVLRNSADHGIETPEVRVQSGKSPEGTIVLRASHQAGAILIEIIDDGAGLNLARIREKAISRNLIAADANLTEEQLRMLIFEPGFSTKEQVSDLSGRGVGMDVVKKNVIALNGTLALDSQQGSGTHIKIQLPLTLAIMEGLIVRVESHSFVIPLISILETVCVQPQDIRNVAGKGEVAIVRDQALPFLRLSRLFGIESDAGLENRKLAVVVEYNQQLAALEIDELLGQQQIVVKSLERNFAKLEGTLGATILGDGKTALILDPQALILHRSKSQTQAAGAARFSLVA